jgi:O-antigen/teichoic acid export membrane protein
VKARIAEFVRSRFVRDTATLQVAGVVNQLSQMVSTVLVAYLLGAEGQGLLVTAIALQGGLHFLVNTGVVPATVAQIAAAAARGNAEKTAGWVAFVAKSVLVFGLAIFAVGWFVLPWIGERWFGSVEVGWWALILCLEPIFDLPRAVAFTAFQGTRRMRALAQLENADEVVRLFLVVLGTLITGDGLGAVVGTVLAAMFGSALAIELWRQARVDGGPPLPGAREIVLRMRDVPLRQGLRLGLRVGLLKNGTSLFLTVFPRLVISRFVGPEYTSYFHIAQRILTIPLMLMQGVSRTALPALGGLSGKRDWTGFRRLYMRVSLGSGFVLGGAILAGIPFIEPLVGWLFPTDYARPVAAYYLVLCAGAVPFTFATANEAFYIATNRVKAWLWLTALGAAITIPLNVVFVKLIPYTGMAWGISLYQSWVLVHLCYIFWVLRTRESFEDAPAPRAA